MPAFVVKSNAQYWKTIEQQYQSIAPDLQGLNRHRYRQITGGNQEFIEALSFQHYLETQTLIPYAESRGRIAAMSGEGGAVELTHEDYILGILDMTGELMRFSITAMATNGKLPAARPARPAGEKRVKRAPSEDHADERMDVDEQASEPRNVLSDLRELRLRLEMFEPAPGSWFGEDVDKKMKVMRECVEKVEKALYSLTVRGSERPKGWVPSTSEDRRPALESY